MFIPFSPPYIDETVIAEVTDSLRSGWITTGPKVAQLEQSIEKLTGSKRVLCVNSWTSGVIMMLKWLGLQPGDEVIIPSYTYCATALAVIHAGGTPVMVDCDRDFLISAEHVAKAITPRTKAILPVDIAGVPCDYQALYRLVNSPSVKVQYQASNEVQQQLGRILILSDSAHSLGAHRDALLGPDVTVFSLHAVKNITTAEGGAICLNLPLPFDNEALYAHFSVWTMDAKVKVSQEITNGNSWHYDVIGPGMKINMPDLNAAIALAQLRQNDALMAQRLRIFKTYNKAFEQCPWAITPAMRGPGGESSYHLYLLRIKDASLDRRNEMIRRIIEHGVAINVHFIPLPLLTYFKSLGYKMEDYPQSYENYKMEISLPIYPQLTDDQVKRVIDAVKDAYEATI